MLVEFSYALPYFIWELVTRIKIPTLNEAVFLNY